MLKTRFLHQYLQHLDLENFFDLFLSGKIFMSCQIFWEKKIQARE
jgi:hypothetical protein